ncbi:hypothetical protein M758_4G079100 [Ceratodon purpureus]|nr:hypothetical protein M758_4G079100 [Ceratodon purpureus]
MWSTTRGPPPPPRGRGRGGRGGGSAGGGVGGLIEDGGLVRVWDLAGREVGGRGWRLERRGEGLRAMAWFSNLNVSDFAGAVTKLSESVKNIEKNFDSALGFESSDSSSGATVRDERPAAERAASVFGSLLPPSITRIASESIGGGSVASDGSHSGTDGDSKPEVAQSSSVEAPEVSEGRSEGGSGVETGGNVAEVGSTDVEAREEETQFSAPQGLGAEAGIAVEGLSKESVRENGVGGHEEEEQSGRDGIVEKEVVASAQVEERSGDQLTKASEPVEAESIVDHGNGSNGVHHGVEVKSDVVDNGVSESSEDLANSDISPLISTPTPETAHETHAAETDSLQPKDVIESQPLVPDSSVQGGDKVEKELKMMEAALLGAARQAQAKADEISRLMVENEQLKATLEELKRKTSEAELDSLREEYQQRISSAERKVYALTKERDMLRREQNRKSDSSMLLKEKDEIIKAVMAEGEELSKKQAVQEGTIKKLRAQVRELEEEKGRLTSRLQVEEAKVESMRKDKAATEKALQEAVEKGQAELAAQKEFYSNALNEAREAAALAEARVDNEARADLDRRLKEASEREISLVQNIDELRQALTRVEQQAAFREDTYRHDVEDLEKRCQAAEARYEELSARMPESTRPLLRHIEALQESMTMRTEAWNGVERSLNSRLQQAEAKAATAQEKERGLNERLNQTLSRMAVMEAQVSCLRAEQAQLQRSLEKERQRASENRQEYLVATEAATTHEGRARQLEEEIKMIRKQYKSELNEEKARREALEQEIEQERAAMAEYEKRIRAEGRAAAEKAVAAAQPNEPGKGHKRWPSAGSQGSMGESLFLQTSFDTTEDRYVGHSDRHSGRFSFSDRPPSPSIHFGKFTYEQLETQLRQKEGELASYASRLAALELTRDSLAEELVKATTQCEALRAEATLLPGMRAELESLRRRHTSALELMGERDEEVEELRADLVDVKHMYREQIDMLVGQIETLSAAVGRK